MSKGIIFGGTSEGRKLCEFCWSNNISILYCVATKDGVDPVKCLPNIEIHIGRLETDKMAELFKQYQPALVIDATHPYATEVSKNIRDACGYTGIRLIRTMRESGELRDCMMFSNIEELLDWLETQSGNIFVTTGASTAAAFTKLKCYQSRVWMRVIPSISSLNSCLQEGYRKDHLICMQGPFSKELNYAMFVACDAQILITKDSGAFGGFSEKVMAAQSLGMTTAVLMRQEDSNGSTFEQTCKAIMEMDA